MSWKACNCNNYYCYYCLPCEDGECMRFQFGEEVGVCGAALALPEYFLLSTS